MNKPNSKKGDASVKKEDVLTPLNEADASKEARRLSPEQIDVAIEEGRKALAELEAASRHHSAMSPKLRFS